MGKIKGSETQWVRNLPELGLAAPLARLAAEELALVDEDRKLSDRRRALRKRLSAVRREAERIAAVNWTPGEIATAKQAAG